MAHLVAEAGLQDRFELDSAGTSAHHIGEAPDRRSAAAAARHGVVLQGRSRQFIASDFRRFDYVIAMDSRNYAALARLAHTADERARLSMMRDYEAGAGGQDVPDPYYGAGDGFEEVYQICLRACRGLLEKLRVTPGVL